MSDLKRGKRKVMRKPSLLQARRKLERMIAYIQNRPWEVADLEAKFRAMGSLFVALGNVKMQLDAKMRKRDAIMRGIRELVRQGRIEPPKGKGRSK